MTVDSGMKIEKLEKKLKYPKSVFFIISNEFCERFSYYGMRTVLALYLNEALGFSENSSTIIYHVFIMLCYFTPLFGGILADAWLGKFKTILYVSMLYATGNIVLSFGSVEAISIPHRELSLIGLLLIAIGTGGIKPCVSSFGGDQFVLPQQEKQLQRFFSVFYFSINAGSVISSFLTPLLRGFHCLGSTMDCYPFAFGLPAALMVVSVIIFVCGSPLYKKIKPQGNIALDVGGCVTHAIAKKMKSQEKKAHWLEYADDKYSQRLIADIKVLMKIMLLFSPTIAFWALFEQQGSKWTFQANRMDGDIGWYTIEPDQMQTLNAFLILIFIPLFESVVYPILAKLRLVKTSLQKLCIGGFLAALAFVVSGIIEIKIQGELPSLPSSGHSHLQLYNSLDCTAQLEGTVSISLPPFSYSIVQNLAANNQSIVKITGCPTKWEGPIALNNEQVSSYILLNNAKGETTLLELNLNGKKDIIKEKPQPRFKVIYSGSDEINVTLQLKDSVKEMKIPAGTHQTNLITLDVAGQYSVTVENKEVSKVKFTQGGTYTLMLYNKQGKMESTLFTVVKPNSVSMLWQVPQYIIITSAEIMFSITGLEFSYSESPKSLKSVISSLWLLTDALGNVIILVIEGFKISNAVLEYFIYAGVMAAAMLVFTYLAIRYKYVTPSEDESNEIHGEENQGYNEEQTKI